jgi:uncharacterized repeat protein (TIGR01451 family)
MYEVAKSRRLCALLLGVCLGAAAGGQAASGPITVKTIAEVETRAILGGREIVKLAPADRVVPGDQVIYTLELRNTDTVTAQAPTVTYPIPEHMLYVAHSAVGPGVDVSFSVDGGHRFDRAENLKAAVAGGSVRTALPADYTHIRWQLKHSLRANSVAFVRFRALVK